MKRLLITGAILALASAAQAEDPAEPVNLFSIKQDGPVAAIQTAFKAQAGQAVRVTVYDSEERFLETPRAKADGVLDDRGLAVVPLNDLEPGEYSFAAYLDENGDGKLNRGKILGFPKEPVAFSNGVVPKLSKPSFKETKVSLDADSIVVITLED